MFKVLIYHFQKYLPTLILANIQKGGLNHMIFLFILLCPYFLFFFFINIIRYIFFLIGKLIPKSAIFKSIHIYLTTLLDYFLVC